MLEDDYLDVLGKAMRGRGVDESAIQVCIQASDAQWRDFMGGVFSPDLARACARELGLAEEAMAGHPDYHPQPVNIAGIRQLVLPFGAYRVNVWWLERNGVAIVFDSGCRAADLAEALPRRPDRAIMTHGHHDHIGGVGALLEMDVPVHAVSDVDGAVAISAGESLAVGPFEIEAIDVSGHFSPALAYLVRGLEQPLMVVGDALFAGSMGKCGSPQTYQLALKTLHRALDDHADSLLLLPGHGPATTLGEERQGNPFLA